MSEKLPQNDEQWRQFIFGVNPKRTLLRVCLWSVSINLVFHLLLLPITVSGSSMSPTYQSGTRNFVNRLSYVREHPERGDVVVVRLGRSDMMIKRIIGLPGETVRIVHGTILIDETALTDAFSKGRIPWNVKPVRLSADQYFVIGDNRLNSVFCPVAEDQIIGKVVF